MYYTLSVYSTHKGGITMATKTFTKEISFSAKTAEKFLDAMDRSQRVDITSKHEIKNAHGKKEINNLLAKALGK